jgi:hypothetical protein
MTMVNGLITENAENTTGTAPRWRAWRCRELLGDRGVVHQDDA